MSLFARLGAAAAALASGMACSAAGVAQAAPAFSPPGVYGRIDMAQLAASDAQKNFAKVFTLSPIKKSDRAYYWVPASHRLLWPEYCTRYRACGLEVELVSDEWYYHEGPGKGLDLEHDHAH